MKQWIKGLLPLILVAGLVLLLFTVGPLGVFQAAFPPVEELTISRIELPRPNQMVLHLVNGGPDPVTVAQVLVDDALWNYTTEPENRTIPRLGRMTVRVPYPWVEGEAHEVAVMTSTGLIFSRVIPVATQSPETNWTYFRTFALLGIYAGVIPVFLGLMWYPFLRNLSSLWIDFFLSLTVGLLFFLAVDTLAEALETAELVPSAFQGLLLVAIGVFGTLLILFYLARSRPERADKATPEGRHWTSLMIAVGIGLHNLGEGLAIGSAYSIGEIALGTFLVVGFMLHNLTEGLGILAPIAKDRPTLARLCLLGLIAGGPTVVGTWIGGFSYSPLWTTLFLAIGAGAILQVIYELSQIFLRKRQPAWISGYSLSGFLLGVLVMYATGLMIVN
ncbi:MAG: ZIP family metal transporter [Acidobacteriota bacterium]